MKSALDFLITVYGTPWATDGMLARSTFTSENTNGILAVLPCSLHILVENSGFFFLARLAIPRFEQIEILVVYLTHGTLFLGGHIFP